MGAAKSGVAQCRPGGDVVHRHGLRRHDGDIIGCVCDVIGKWPVERLLALWGDVVGGRIKPNDESMRRLEVRDERIYINMAIKHTSESVA